MFSIVKVMRITYREQLDDFSHDLIIMCDLVGSVMTQATAALLTAALPAAESALSGSDELAEIRTRCDQRAVELLPLEGPVASDLRQVISSLHIVAHVDRMGGLAMHIARTAQRRYPDHVLPGTLQGPFEELAGLVHDMTDKVRQLLIAPDAETALELDDDDQAVDDLTDILLTKLTQQPWGHSTWEAVDTALLLRFFERYCDHCVEVAASIVYLTSGRRPTEYLAEHQRHDTLDDADQHFGIPGDRF